jgi:orotidine-5'-phosphate decarboxylase
VGLDPHPGRLPDGLGGTEAQKISDFCRGAVDAVAELAVAVKPQVALFERHGGAGVVALAQVVAHARQAGLMVVLDAKRGDIGSTAEAYAHATLDDDGPMGADSVTLSPYLGAESLAPFERRFGAGKAAFLLLRTSNPGAEAWQRPVVPMIADFLRASNRAGGAYGAVVGATIPGDEAVALREMLPRCWFLVPGFGAQGGGLDAVARLQRPDGGGALVTSSRAVLFPSGGRAGAHWVEGVRMRAQKLVDELRELA